MLLWVIAQGRQTFATVCILQFKRLKSKWRTWKGVITNQVNVSPGDSIVSVSLESQLCFSV